MRFHWLVVCLLGFPGCNHESPEDKAKIQQVKAYLLKVVESENRYHYANQTYSLNMKELYDFDPSLDQPPAGYQVKGGGRLALAFGYEVNANPQSGTGPHLYVNQSGVVRYSMRGEADAESKPVE
jgi:Tfp pilus assembly protein PilE